MNEKVAVRNAADPEQVKAAGQAEKRVVNSYRDDLRWVMSTAQGRRLIAAILAQCGANRISFSDSDRITSFNEGSRNIALMLQADLEQACPDLHLKLMMESYQAKHSGETND